MTTIKDVALRAGVSVTTVSHVVNDTRHVSAKGRERVELAIRELGYVPSAVARSLKSNTTRTLGMLIPNSSNPYFAEIVRIVEDRCFGAGYTLILCNTDDEPRRQSIYLQVLAERRIDGLIVVSTGGDDSLDNPPRVAGDHRDPDTPRVQGVHRRSRLRTHLVLQRERSNQFGVAQQVQHRRSPRHPFGNGSGQRVRNARGVLGKQRGAADGNDTSTDRCSNSARGQ